LRYNCQTQLHPVASNQGQRGRTGAISVGRSVKLAPCHGAVFETVAGLPVSWHSTLPKCRRLGYEVTLIVDDGMSTAWYSPTKRSG
jgi:hypothetical protein